MKSSNTIRHLCQSLLQATMASVDAVARSFVSRSRKAAPLYIYPRIIGGELFAVRKMDALVYGSPRALPNLTERNRRLFRQLCGEGKPQNIAIDGWGHSVLVR